MNEAAPLARSSEDAPPVPSAPPSQRRRELAVFAGLFLAFALARGVVFPFAENLYGDAVVRSELAERWADDPRLLRSFADDTYQFGPLHFYYMGAVLELWPSREHATRFSSLLMGLLLLVPVYRLGRRLFSREAAVATALAIAVWGLHIQASTTAASEALFMTLFFFALDFLFKGIEEERFAPMAAAALFVNLFCATRYDGWMYAPLLGLAVALSGPDRVASVTRAVLFLALCLPWPLWWMQTNEKAMGDPLYAIHYIDEFHARWAAEGIASMGQVGFRAMSLFFWPGSLLVTCSLLVGVFALAGIVRAFRRREKRALALLAIVPALYFTFRGAVLANFSPLARFTMVQLALSLFYVKDGFDWIAGRWPAWARRALAGAAALLAVGTTLWLGHLTAWKSGPLEDSLRPISPLSTIPTEQMAVARFLKENVAAGEAVILDEEPGYVDINVAFFTGLPESRLIRLRWENFEAQLQAHPGAPWLFAAAGGALQAREAFPVGEEIATWRGATWRRVAAPSPALFVYRRQ
jgi:hypothetical protein